MSKTIFRLFLTGVIFCMTLEVAARVHDRVRYDAPLLERYSSSRLRGHDSNGLRHNIPGSRFEKWKNNNFGFRGVDIKKEKLEGTKRLFCMGESETYGLYETPGNEWPSQLRRVFSQSSDYEIINSATVGLSIPNYAAYFEKYILPLDPDSVVVLATPYSYVVSLIRKQIKEEHGGEEKMHPSRGAKKERLEFSFRILPKIKQIIKTFLPSFIVKKVQIYSLEKQVALAENLRLGGSKPLDVIPSIYIDDFAEKLQNLVNTINGYGVDVVLASYPMLLDKKNAAKYPVLYLGIRRFFVELTLDGMVDLSKKCKDATIRISAQTNSMFIDLEKMVPKNTDYFADSVHYTDKGATLVAQAVADHTQLIKKK